MHVWEGQSPVSVRTASSGVRVGRVREAWCGELQAGTLTQPLLALKRKAAFCSLPLSFRRGSFLNVTTSKSHYLFFFLHHVTAASAFDFALVGGTLGPSLSCCRWRVGIPWPKSTFFYITPGCSLCWLRPLLLSCSNSEQPSVFYFKDFLYLFWCLWLILGVRSNSCLLTFLVGPGNGSTALCVCF